MPWDVKIGVKQRIQLVLVLRVGGEEGRFMLPRFYVALCITSVHHKRIFFPYSARVISLLSFSFIHLGTQTFFFFFKKPVYSISYLTAPNALLLPAMDQRGECFWSPGSHSNQGPRFRHVGNVKHKIATRREFKRSTRTGGVENYYSSVPQYKHTLDSNSATQKLSSSA